MDFIKGQNTRYFSWDFDFKILVLARYNVKLPGLLRNGPLDPFWNQVNQPYYVRENIKSTRKEV